MNDLEAAAIYKHFIQAVVSTENLWAIWCGNSWANVADPDRGDRVLFLLWSTEEDAIEMFNANREKFPSGSIVDRIDVHKWITRYTPDLIESGAFAFISPNREVSGVAVAPEDLSSDLQRTLQNLELQSTDLAELHKKVRARLSKNAPPKGKGRRFPG